MFSTQALSVVRRRAQFALLRTLGMTRGALAALLVVEGALVGARRRAARPRGRLRARVRRAARASARISAPATFAASRRSVALDPVAARVFGALGIAAAVLGSLVPAREAARAQPAAALKAGDEQQAFARLRSPLAGHRAARAPGAAMTLLPPVAACRCSATLAIALLLVGTLLLLPRIALAGARARCRAPRAVPAALALAQLRGAPGQASVSLATIVASVSLMVSMAIMVASFRQSLDDWLVRVLPADVYVRAGSAGDSAFLPPDEQRALAAVPGVARIAFLRAQSVLLDPARPRVALLARDLPRDDPGAALPLVGDASPLRAGDPPPVWVSEAMADLYGIAPGRARRRCRSPDATRTFVVAGVWRDYARQQGAIVIDRDALRRADRRRRRHRRRAVARAGRRPSRSCATRIEARCPARRARRSRTPGEIRAISLRIFDRTFAVTYALLAVAVRDRPHRAVVVVRRAGARAPARVRHAAPPRHDAPPDRRDARHRRLRRQRASGSRSASCSASLMSLILVHVVNRQSFHWGMERAHAVGARSRALAAVLLVAAVATTRRQRAPGDGRRRRARGEGGLVMRPAPTFLHRRRCSLAACRARAR